MWNVFRKAFSPNAVISGSAAQTLVMVWAVLFLVSWWVAMPALIPTPLEVIKAVGSVWSDGLLYELLVSLKVYLEAVAITAAISMGLAYASVMPVIRPPATLIIASRFLGMAGLTFAFTLLIGGGHWLKVALMVFGMTVFTLDGMSKMVASVTREQLNHARTLRMSEWRAVWEVIVVGKADQALDILRQNAAMGWMMLPMVEGIVRSEGGVGTMLLAQTKHFHLDQVFAIQLIILWIGLGQDWLIGTIRAVLFPWADLKAERQ